MKTRIILNPNARQGDRASALESLVGSWDEAELCRTEEAGQASDLARQAAEQGFEAVVAAGGDGTVNEVLCGLEDHLEQVRLGILPLGTGNDFARCAEIPLELGAAVEVVRAGHSKACDIGRYHCGDHRGLFLNLAAAGFSGEVDHRLDSEMKRFWGPLAYLRAAVETMPELTPYRLTLTLDDDEPKSLVVVNVAVANGRFVAAGLPVAPRAEIDDGLLDVVIFQARRIGELMALAPRALAGKHLEDPEGRVSFFRARRVRLDSRPQMPFNVDGELVGEGPADFEVLPGAIQLLQPVEE
ncbi:MAG: diacylglycerol kinase family lipid kinase [Acidobacteriota bacterium]|nr:diacylglycerol kinase family lipid kinase [Acidobacteriota bacterium]